MKELIKFKIKDGETEVEFSFVERTKAIQREADAVYAKTYASCVRQGFLTNAEALKYANERGGVLSETEREEYEKKISDIAKVKSEIEKETEEEKLKALKLSLTEASEIIRSLNAKVQDIFQYTAETVARDMTATHYALASLYVDGKPFFLGKDFETRKKGFEDSESPLVMEAVKRAQWYATLVMMGISDFSNDDYLYPDKI